MSKLIVVTAKGFNLSNEEVNKWIDGNNEIVQINRQLSPAGKVHAHVNNSEASKEQEVVVEIQHPNDEKIVRQSLLIVLRVLLEKSLRSLVVKTDLELRDYVELNLINEPVCQQDEMYKYLYTVITTKK